MAWRDQLVDASFRGVLFFVDRATLQSGRRTVVHEFPGRTTPLVEDLGRAPRRWQLEMVVLGDDYLYARDQLRLALERPGPGDLVLPTMGTVRAVAEGASSFAENTADGGLCRITATFVEATSQLRVASMDFPALEVSDAYAAVQTQAALAVIADIDAAREQVALTTTVDATYTQPAIAELAEALRAEATIADQVRACAATLRDVQRQIGAAGDRAKRMAEQAVALARMPGDIVAEVFATAGDLVDAVIAMGSAAGGLLRGLDLGWRLRDLARGAATSIQRSRPQATQAPPETPASLFAQAVAASISRITATAVVAAVAKASVDLDFRSANSAAQLADALCDVVDLALTDPPATPAAERLRVELRTLRTACVRHLRSMVDELPRIGTHTPQATLPDLVIAQQLYGDAMRHEEIRRLNDLPNPLFCAAGVPLEVLSGE